jgi:hypothetical protein
MSTVSEVQRISDEDSDGLDRPQFEVVDNLKPAKAAAPTQLATPQPAKDAALIEVVSDQPAKVAPNQPTQVAAPIEVKKEAPQSLPPIDSKSLKELGSEDKALSLDFVMKNLESFIALRHSIASNAKDNKEFVDRFRDQVEKEDQNIKTKLISESTPYRQTDSSQARQTESKEKPVSSFIIDPKMIDTMNGISRQTNIEQGPSENTFYFETEIPSEDPYVDFGEYFAPPINRGQKFPAMKVIMDFYRKQEGNEEVPEEI